VTPEAPEAMSSTVSLVDMQPSESMRSKVTAWPPAGRVEVVRDVVAGDDGIGGDDDEHRRERRGEHAGALGHATDRPAVTRRRRGLGHGVGRHDGGRGGRGPPSTARASTAASTPGRRRSMGRRSPMRPVEQTTTSPAATPSTSATCSAVRWVSWKPGAPVQAFAPPVEDDGVARRPDELTSDRG
jgi:hypothetical protein